MKRKLLLIAAAVGLLLPAAGLTTGAIAPQAAPVVAPQKAEALTSAKTEKCLPGSPHDYKITWNTAAGNTTVLRTIASTPVAYATGPGFAYAFTFGWYGWYVQESPSGVIRYPGTPPSSYYVTCN